MPVPLRMTECGLPAALSLMLTAPDLVPVALGVKVRFTVQLEPAATVPQLLFCAKSPLALTLLIVNDAFPAFVTLKLLLPLVVFTSCVENVRLEGESETRGAMAVLQVPPVGATPVPPLNS